MAGSYRWKPGSAVKIDPDKAGAELERIRVKANGRLTPDGVVTAAEKRTSALHAHFEWDDSKAAVQHRLTQASYLIRSIEVVALPEAPTKGPVRAFVSVAREQDRSYTSTAHALSDAELRAQVVATALAELVAWRRRHAELVELADMFAMIEARAA